MFVKFWVSSISTPSRKTVYIVLFTFLSLSKALILSCDILFQGLKLWRTMSEMTSGILYSGTEILPPLFCKMDLVTVGISTQYRKYSKSRLFEGQYSYDPVFEWSVQYINWPFKNLTSTYTIQDVSILVSFRMVGLSRF